MQAPNVTVGPASGAWLVVLSCRLAGHALQAGTTRDLGLPGWALLTASVAADVALALALRRGVRPGWPVVGAAVVDAAAWSVLAGRGASSAFGLHIAAIPVAYVVALWERSGTDAVPVLDPRSPWPPSSTGAWARAIGLLACAGFGPALAAEAVRLVRGLGPTPGQLVWGAVGTGVGLGVARWRDRGQADLRRRWAARADQLAAGERFAAQLALATEAGEAHDFKRTLLALSVHGSDAAGQASRERAAHPGELLATAPGGTTLRDASFGARLEPPEAGALWLSDEETARLRHFLDDQEERADGAGSLVLEVERHDGGATVRYLGGRHEIGRTAPAAAGKLDPAVTIFAFAAILGAFHLVDGFGRMHWVVVVPFVAWNVAGAVRWSRPSQDAPLRPLWSQGHRHGPSGTTVVSGGGSVGASDVVEPTTWLAAGCVLWVLAGATPLAAVTDGTGHNAFVGASGAGVLLLGLSRAWSGLRSWQRWLLPVALLGGPLSARLRGAFSGRELLGILALEAVAVGAFWDFARRSAGELAVVNDALAERFVERCRAERDAVVAEEVDRQRTHLALARSELDRLGPRVPPAVRVAVEADCAGLAAWLDRHGSRSADSDPRPVTDPDEPPRAPTTV